MTTLKLERNKNLVIKITEIINGIKLKINLIRKKKSRKIRI